MTTADVDCVQVPVTLLCRLSKKINQSRSSVSCELKKTRAPLCEWGKPPPGALLLFKLNTNSWGTIDLKLSKKDGGRCLIISQVINGHAKSFNVSRLQHNLTQVTY